MDSTLQQVIDEQVQTGQAVIVKINNIDCIQFVDEDEPIPLTDLDYNQEIGLYQKSKFPVRKPGRPKQLQGDYELVTVKIRKDLLAKIKASGKSRREYIEQLLEQ